MVQTNDLDEEELVQLQYLDNEVQIEAFAQDPVKIKYKSSKYLNFMSEKKTC